MATQQGRWILGGGLASGKSAVRRLLDVHGVVTIDADEIGHSVLEPDGSAFDSVAEAWPEVVKNGRVDRGALAAIVFPDPGALRRLESITHPHIFDTIRSRAEHAEGPVVVEVPVIADHLGRGWRRLVVDCRDEAKLHRAVARGMDESDAEARLAAQPSRAAWLAAADLVVPNHGTEAELQTCVALVAGQL